MLKFKFSVSTRNGLQVDNILIYGKDLPDAERKLCQMYQHCRVLQCTATDTNRKVLQSADIEDVLSLIINEV